jgi:hypothetical protein
MSPGVLLPDPVWNLVLICWMDLQMLTICEMDVEERERQLTVTRPKTMTVLKVGFSRFAGRTLPSRTLKPSP